MKPPRHNLEPSRHAPNQAVSQRSADFCGGVRVRSGASPLRVLHVTGTKGKGSTCAYVDSLLRARGARTGERSSLPNKSNSQGPDST